MTLSHHVAIELQEELFLVFFLLCKRGFSYNISRRDILFCPCQRDQCSQTRIFLSRLFISFSSWLLFPILFLSFLLLIVACYLLLLSLPLSSLSFCLFSSSSVLRFFFLFVSLHLSDLLLAISSCCLSSLPLCLSVCLSVFIIVLVSSSSILVFPFCWSLSVV